MSSAPLTRQQRLKLQKLGDRIDRLTQADRRFFERRPDRQHRVRLASQAEIDLEAMVFGGAIELPDDRQQFVVVKNVAQGVRMRMIVIEPMHADTDLDEETARAIFAVTAKQDVLRTERVLRSTET